MRAQGNRGLFCIIPCMLMSFCVELLTREATKCGKMVRVTRFFELMCNSVFPNTKLGTPFYVSPLGDIILQRLNCLGEEVTKIK